MSNIIQQNPPSISRARRNTIGELLARSAARYPNKEALIFEDERLTYEQLDTRVNQAAHMFASEGLARGMRLAILSRNSLDFVVAAYAAARIGVTIVPINYMLTVEDIAYILGHCQANALAAPLELASHLEGALSSLSASQVVPIVARFALQSRANLTVDGTLWKSLRQTDEFPASPPDTDVENSDIAQILYTSGTESKPKGVMLTHDNLIAQYVSCIVDGGMETSDVAIHALPLYHSAQMNCFLGPSIYLGGKGVILEQAAPNIILETIAEERISQLFCPPTVWIALLRHPDFSKRNLSCLQKCYYGAAIMPMEVLKELSAQLPEARFWNFYGQTEVAPLATALQPEDQMRKLGSAGRPVLNVETRIVDDEGNEVERGTVGEIVHRTAHAMLGYFNDTEKTAAAFSHGWFHSGDLGVMDDEGYITVVDRKKDMIKTGGVNVASREVEEVIYEHPDVSEVAVIGIPDDYWIEAVTALVVPKPESALSAEILDSHCHSRLAKFKRPKHYIIVESLPRNPSGKILKKDLRETYNDYA